MAFSEETILEAWKRANGQCECDKRTHSHFRVPCFKPLSWKDRGTAVRDGWEAHRITLSGGDGLYNCQILCWSCHQETGYEVPKLEPNFYTGPTNRVKIGDYIRLDSGDEGRVTEIRFDSVCIKTLDSREIVVSNSQIRRILINYGPAPKKAIEPFRFQSLSLLRRITGLKAKNLTELVDILKIAPDGVIYYHTHQFLQENNYLIPEPPNDFAVWVSASLGDEILGERLSNVNPFSFHDMAGIKEKLVNIIEEHLSQYSNHREAMEGNEFYFVKSARFVFSTPYVVNDLRELVGALRKISAGSLYLHIFESRLASAKGLNDISSWLIERLGEEELGRLIARIDPYAYTLEGLRSSLIKLIENRIK
jgi:hypothetical protein